MTYWRMQLHPGDPANAAAHAIRSTAAGFIGLDFLHDTGDLRTADYDALPPGQKDYWTFAHDMQIDDKVLIIVHHFPFALVTVAGEYNYIARPEPELGVWFRHFRRVAPDVRYFADYVTNAASWEQYTMTDTISPLRDPGSKSYRLIEEWKQ